MTGLRPTPSYAVMGPALSAVVGDAHESHVTGYPVYRVKATPSYFVAGQLVYRVERPEGQGRAKERLFDRQEVSMMVILTAGITCFAWAMHMALLHLSQALAK